MSEGQEIPVEIQNSLPKVKYSEAVTAPECPYDVNVNQQAAALLLERAGVPVSEIDKLIIEIKRRHPLKRNFIPGDIFGKFYKDEGKLTIFADAFWKRQEKWRKKAEQLANKEQPTEGTKSSRTEFPRMPEDQSNYFPELHSGKRLSWYLTVAPHERGLAMAQKLINKASLREVNETAQHEAKHAGDFAQGENQNNMLRKLIIWGISAAATGVLEYLALREVSRSAGVKRAVSLAGSAIGMIATPLAIEAGIGYRLSPSELSARKFANKLKSEPQYQFVSIVPKLGSR